MTRVGTQQTILDSGTPHIPWPLNQGRQVCIKMKALWDSDKSCVEIIEARKTMSTREGVDILRLSVSHAFRLKPFYCSIRYDNAPP